MIKKLQKRGLTYKQIADRLKVTERSIYNYVQEIQEPLYSKGKILEKMIKELT